MILFLIYITGMVVGTIGVLLLCAKAYGRITLGDLRFSVILGSFSWVSVAILVAVVLIKVINWDTTIWKRKNK